MKNLQPMVEQKQEEKCPYNYFLRLQERFFRIREW